MKTIKGNITIFLACAITCAFVFAVSAEASLCNDPNAMTGFTGRTSFDIMISEADVYYAVYAPDTYPGKDLTGGSEYIYAYQIINSPHANVAIDFFSVGISSGVVIDNIYTDNTYGSGVDPLLSNIFAQSAWFIFADQSLNSREWSKVLIFTSVLSPTMGFGTISGGGASGMAALPTPSMSPVPEPATIALLLPAILIFKPNRREISQAK
ncbi:MAG: hypothetical protein ABR969_02155 [Sedimentisphaerales bacterium]|jgi:hypothetical protein